MGEFPRKMSLWIRPWGARRMSAGSAFLARGPATESARDRQDIWGCLRERSRECPTPVSLGGTPGRCFWNFCSGHTDWHSTRFLPVAMTITSRPIHCALHTDGWPGWTSQCSDYMPRLHCIGHPRAVTHFGTNWARCWCAVLYFTGSDFCLYAPFHFGVKNKWFWQKMTSFRQPASELYSLVPNFPVGRY